MNLTTAQQRALKELKAACPFHRESEVKVHWKTAEALKRKGMMEPNGRISAHGKRRA